MQIPPACIMSRTIGGMLYSCHLVMMHSDPHEDGTGWHWRDMVAFAWYGKPKA